MTTYGNELAKTNRVARMARPRRRHAEWTRYGIYRDNREGFYFLAKCSDSTKARLRRFADSQEAFAWFADQRRAEAAGLPTEFAALWAAGKPQTAPAKTEAPMARMGGHVAVLGGSTPAEMAAALMARWGFRGVEFGSSVGKARQIAFLQSVHQAMSDLDLIGLGCIAEGVGLSCGLRTLRGSAGHFEPSTGVISFPASAVGGSLAHELWHAFERRLPAEVLATILAAMPEAYVARSRRLDVQRGRRYFAIPCELTARAFESVVRYHLAGTPAVVNHWLSYPSNYSSDDTSCPWLTPAEVVQVSKAFSDALRGA